MYSVRLIFLIFLSTSLNILYSQTNINSNFTVVIDPGHGGKDLERMMYLLILLKEQILQTVLVLNFFYQYIVMLTHRKHMELKHSC